MLPVSGRNFMLDVNSLKFNGGLDKNKRIRGVITFHILAIIYDNIHCKFLYAYLHPA